MVKENKKVWIKRRILLIGIVLIVLFSLNARAEIIQLNGCDNPPGTAQINKSNTVYKLTQHSSTIYPGNRNFNKEISVKDVLERVRMYLGVDDTC